MKRTFPTRAAWAAAAGALAVAALAGAAWAHRHDGHERGERHERDERHQRGDASRRDGGRAAPMPAVYQQECGGSCHVAYPPGLLPAASWKRVMDGLERHYGSDASLDAASAKTIAAWLDANAGTGRRARGAPPEDRITKSAWFLREHDEIRPAVWTRAAVASPANCAACHPRADQGDFEEHDVRIPE